MSKFLLIPTAVMALAAALIFYSVSEIRTAARRDADAGWGWVQIDPELQRVALAYFKEEVRTAKRDQEAGHGYNRVAATIPKTSEPDKAFSDSLRNAIDVAPKTSPNVKPAK